MFWTNINSLLQGLTHLGKGTLTLCPYHSDRQLMSQVAVAGLLTVLVSFLDVKNSEPIFLFLHILHFQFWILKKHFLYCICVHFLPGVHCASYSNSGKISLHSVRPGGSHAATHARDLWWGTATPACICSSWTGETLISPLLTKLLNGEGMEVRVLFC